jgi:hypothetical protein
MEKTYQLDQREVSLFGQADQERTQALAVVGALSLDMETARKNLDTAAERQRMLIRQALSNRGVERYENARVQNGSLFVSMPDMPVSAPPEPEGGVPMDRVNGPVKQLKHAKE